MNFYVGNSKPVVLFYQKGSIYAIQSFKHYKTSTSRETAYKTITTLIIAMHKKEKILYKVA